MNSAFFMYSSSLSVSSTCRDYFNILDKHGPWGQRPVPGGGAGEGYAGPQRRLLLLHHRHRQPDWCQWQWTHIPAPWVTYTAWLSDANTRPYPLGGSMKEYKALQTVRTCLILYLRGIYLITFLQCGWAVCAASAAFVCTHFVIQTRIKRRRMRDRDGESKSDGERRRGYSVRLRVHTYMCRPLDEFNHSHMKGHLSWPLETNLAFSAINLSKWMPWEEINSVEMRQQGRCF